MKIDVQYTDEVSASLTIGMERADYEEKYEKALRQVRQRISMPGFRAGKVPTGLVRKMHGTAVLIEEINKIVSTTLLESLREKELEILGEPMLAKDSPVNDFEHLGDYTFVFDLALSPKIDVHLGKEDKIPYYTVPVEEKEVDASIEQLTSRYGSNVEMEEAREGDILYCNITNDTMTLDDGAPFRVLDASIMSKYMPDEEERAKFNGAKLGDEIVFDAHKAYQGNAYELASLLKVDRKDVDDLQGKQFVCRINKITRHVPADLNEAFFLKAYPDNETVRDEAALRESLRESIGAQHLSNSAAIFQYSLLNYLENRIGELALAEDPIKRWMQAKNEKMSAEEIDAEFPKMRNAIRREIVLGNLMSKYEIPNSDSDELLAGAVERTKIQFAQYGFGNVPDEMYRDFAAKMLAKEDEARLINQTIRMNKLGKVAQELVTLEKEELTKEEFNAKANAIVGAAGDNSGDED